jgi:putative component of toxin-antitoxin plasmid stabilization module
MYTFALNKINEIEGKLKFYKLLVNGNCEFDLFWKQCEADGNLKSELLQIQSRMQQLANLKTMPADKHKDITPKNDLVKEYEIKTKHLRVYMFHDKENGRVIVSGGKKTTQPKDITHFRNVKKEYFNQKK